jgi:hypothetical protein
MPPELVDAYYEMLRDNMKNRLANDEDYKEAKKGN